MNREQILAGPVLAHVDLVVPAWARTVRVREMTARERDSFEAAIVTSALEVSRENFRGHLLVRSLVDPETGARIFADGDAGALGEQPASVLQSLFVEAMRLSALTDSDVDELRGNSGGGPGDGSPSGSPTGSG